MSLVVKPMSAEQTCSRRCSETTQTSGRTRSVVRVLIAGIGVMPRHPPQQLNSCPHLDSVLEPFHCSYVM
ncbi:hypothetical protein Y032_0005g2443 [Ancylostoma ceylanicum]|uniref:Uncharacterized protein n=1 Tax=Ancylostoma ceylanicum TaxID=53326 RepID=A0A016VSU3_9BILA|nr:hypothetical protein Y032_0005g2443 [Ancylostoma ceylanicum]